MSYDVLYLTFEVATYLERILVCLSSAVACPLVVRPHVVAVAADRIDLN